MLALEDKLKTVKQRRPARWPSTTTARADVFASKALPCTAVLRIFAEEGLGCDVASGGELHLALRAGFDPAVLYLHGNAKSDAELAQALDAGVGTIVLDHPAEAERLDALVGPGRRQRVLVRVTPGVDADTHASISPARRARSSASCSPGRRRVERARDWAGLELAGLHMHIGSQLFDARPWRARSRRSRRSGDFAVYDLGGGLGVAYTRRATGRRRSTRGSPAWATRATSCRARLRARARAGPRARRQRRRDALPRRVGQARRVGVGRASTAACPTTCARCSTARPTRRRSPTASAARASRASSSASTASPATCWCATRGCPTPAAATWSSTP